MRKIVESMVTWLILMRPLRPLNTSNILLTRQEKKIQRSSSRGLRSGMSGRGRKTAFVTRGGHLGRRRRRPSSHWNKKKEVDGSGRFLFVRPSVVDFGTEEEELLWLGVLDGRSEKGILPSLFQIGPSSTSESLPPHVLMNNRRRRQRRKPFPYHFLFR